MPIDLNLIAQIYLFGIIGSFFGSLLFILTDKSENQYKLKVSEAILVSFKKTLYALPWLVFWVSLLFTAQFCYYHFIYLPRV